LVSSEVSIFSRYLVFVSVSPLASTLLFSDPLFSL